MSENTESSIKTDTDLYEKCRNVANNKVLGYSFWFYPRVAFVNAVHNEVAVQDVIEGKVRGRW